MTVTVPTVLLVLPVLVLVAVGWWLLGLKAVAWATPKLERWYWHRLGGEGDPPADVG